MSNNDEEDKSLYKVVLNHEEQYSIWPADLEKPSGWKYEGQSGTKPGCCDPTLDPGCLITGNGSIRQLTDPLEVMP